MEKTPKALRKHVVILGRTNAGKSTLFNALTGQNRAIIADSPGTTTDPVDAAIYVQDGADADMADYEAFRATALDHLLVFTKQHGAYPGAFFFENGGDLSALRMALADLLAKQEPEEMSLLAGLVPAGGHVVLVTPIDSAAPKGRLILPQVQALRDALDYGLTCTVCRETELEAALANCKRTDLVVTDSQVFPLVDRLVPKHIRLTSFSMLLARQKSDFAQLLAGVSAVPELPDGARVLMLEGCTHNHTHEDIGRVKIPAFLQTKTGKSFVFDYYSGYDFPDDLSGYALAVQCGGCMLNRRELAARLARMAAAGLPATNYGILLAYCAGALERSCAAFDV